MLWIYGCLIFIIGIIIGVLAARIGTKGGKKQKDLEKALEKSQYELEQTRQELVDHFAQSANLMDDLSKNYQKLYAHMSKTSQALMPSLPSQDNPFAQVAPSLTAEAPEHIKSDTTEETIEEIGAEINPETAVEALEVSEETQKSDTDNKTEEEAPKDYADSASGLISGKDPKPSETEKSDKAQ